LPLSARPEPPPDRIGGASMLRRQSWARLGAFVSLEVLAVLVMVLLCRSLPVQARTPFDSRPLAHLQRLQPQFVLMGNSMVDTRFDESTLSRSLSPRRVAVLGMAATKSAVWYLALKNLVIASGARPRVLQFFRYLELTDPRARALDDDHGKLERVSIVDDPVVEKKLAPPLTQPIAWFDWYRERAVPLRRLQEKTAPLVDDVGATFSRLLWRGGGSDARKRQINELFALEHLRVAEVPPEAAAERIPQFDDVVAGSLLPDMCQLAKDNGIALTFIHVRTRDAAAGERETPAAQQYLADLQRYVQGCGAEFYDMQDASWESLDWYGNGDHIAAQFKRRYSALFAEHMARVFH
jgi:hypothetical protein